MLLANFDRKEHLQHRAVSLRQHGFLVLHVVVSHSISYMHQYCICNELTSVLQVTVFSPLEDTMDWIVRGIVGRNTDTHRELNAIRYDSRV